MNIKIEVDIHMITAAMLYLKELGHEYPTITDAMQEIKGICIASIESGRLGEIMSEIKSQRNITNNSNDGSK